MCCEGNQYYLKQTFELRKGRQKLFIAYKKVYNAEAEIHMNIISSWLKKTIFLAYHNSTEKDRQMVAVKAHQVRSMAALWALHANHSMEDIMMACFFCGSLLTRSPHSTSRICNSVTTRCTIWGHLGPVVAASQLC